MSQPRMPKCGDAFDDPIPTKTGAYEKSHSTTILESFLETDGKQCAVWKDEVNTLLIFAGLFSAVVTAFLVESYKFLQPPNQTTEALHRLSDKFEMLALGIRSDTPLSPGVPLVDISSTFTPSAQSVRINILWFSSLVLSLATVVIGIIALQWLRSHQWYYDGMSPKSSLGIYQMRQSAKDTWKLQGVFTALPLLILVALILFFVGLVDFLVSLNHRVAVPVGVLAYGTLAILLTATILPSLQIFKLHFFPPILNTGADIPTPCPYKSPQSWIFHRFCIKVINMISTSLRYIMRTELRWQESVELSLSDAPLHFLVESSPTEWTQFDRKWVQLRDFYALWSAGYPEGSGHFAPFSLEHHRRPIYDEVLMLVRAISVPPNAEVPFAAYHCFSEVSRNALYQSSGNDDAYADPQHDNKHNLNVRGYCWNHLSLPVGSENPQPRFGPPISDLIRNPSNRLLHDENMLVFLEMITSHNLPEEVSHIISAHLCELQARIFAYVYAEPALQIQLPSGEAMEESSDNSVKFQWLLMMSQQYIDMINSTNALPKFKIWSQFSSSSLADNEVSVSSVTIGKAIIQYAMIFERFVHHVAVSKHLDWQETIYAHQDVAQFLKAPAIMLRYTGTAQIPFDSFSKFENSFYIIQAALSNHATPNTHGDYLFLSACFLIEQLFNPYAELPLKPFDQKQCDRMAAFIKALDAYEQAAGYPPVGIQDNWQEFWSDTGLPKVPRFDCRPSPSRRSYIRWNTIPTWINIGFTAPSAN